MSNLDERKVKDLLHKVVEGVYSLLEGNYRNDMMVGFIHTEIDEANLLTDQAPCATVKKQIEDAAKQEPIKVKKQPRLFK